MQSCEGLTGCKVVESSQDVKLGRAHRMESCGELTRFKVVEGSQDVKL